MGDVDCTERASIEKHINGVGNTAARVAAPATYFARAALTDLHLDGDVNVGQTRHDGLCVLLDMAWVRLQQAFHADEAQELEILVGVLHELAQVTA